MSYNTIVKYAGLASSFLLFCACAAEGGPETPSGEPAEQNPTIPVVEGRTVVTSETYTELSGESGGVFSSVPSICELAYMFDGGAGEYRVNSITGVSEEWEDSTGVHAEPAIWVELQAIGARAIGASESLTLRLVGGPEADGSFLEPSVHLATGESYLLLYTGARDYTLGFSTTAEHGILTVDDGVLEGSFGVFALTPEQFVQRYDAATAVLRPFRNSDISVPPRVNWETVCPQETLELPVPFTTPEPPATDSPEGFDEGQSEPDAG